MPQSRSNRRSQQRRLSPRRPRKPQSETVALLRSINDATLQKRPKPAVLDPQAFTMKRNKVYTFNRSYQVTVSTGTVPSGISYYFTLDSLPDYTDFTNLFDQYKIIQAKCIYTPNSDSDTLTVPNVIYTCIDHDDDVAPSLPDILQYQTMQTNEVTDTFVRVVNPCISLAAYSGAFTSYTSTYGMWLDCASASIRHYGLKAYVFGAPSLTALGAFTFQVTVSFKGPR